MYAVQFIASITGIFTNTPYISQLYCILAKHKTRETEFRLLFKKQQYFFFIVHKAVSLRL